MSNISGRQWSYSWTEIDQAQYTVTKLTTHLMNANKAGLSLGRRARIGKALNKARARLLALNLES